MSLIVFRRFWLRVGASKLASLVVLILFFDITHGAGSADTHTRARNNGVGNVDVHARAMRCSECGHATKTYQKCSVVSAGTHAYQNDVLAVTKK